MKLKLLCLALVCVTGFGAQEASAKRRRVYPGPGLQSPGSNPYTQMRLIQWEIYKLEQHRQTLLKSLRPGSMQMRNTEQRLAAKRAELKRLQKRYPGGVQLLSHL